MSRGTLPTTPMPITTDSNERLRMMAFALGGALRGDPNFAQQTLALRKQQQQQLQQQQRQTKLQELAQTDPNLARMYELFGERGLQQGYLQQQEQEQKLIEDRQQIQALQGAGFSNQEINLVLAGVPAKDVIGFRETGQLSGQELIDKVEENVDTTVKETGVLDTFANLDQAFGPVDALQEGLGAVTRKLGFDVDKKTAAAVRARNSLNLEILANLAADFTGRPNMLIYEEIKANLPTTALTTETDAREKYENIRDLTDQRISSLKEGLKSSLLSDSDKNSYREELDKSITLSKKLDSAILSLAGGEKDILEVKEESVSEPSRGFERLYLENNNL